MRKDNGIFKDLERLLAEFDFENVLASASETFEIRELMDEAAERGQEHQGH